MIANVHGSVEAAASALQDMPVTTPGSGRRASPQNEWRRSKREIFAGVNGYSWAIANPGPEVPLLIRESRLQHGFTLMKLLVVLVIVGLLSGYVGLRLFAQIGKVEVKVARAQMDALQKGLDQHRIDNGKDPATALGVAALMMRTGDNPRWAGPNLTKAVPLNLWGRTPIYRSPSEHVDSDLLTLGLDGRPGGIGEDADLNSC